jgi:ABC-type lipoprotein export system ATPase subunit
MIECRNLVKIYKTKEIEVVALQGLDLRIEEGEMLAIIGNSGSGKSTLLNMLGALDTPSAGQLLVNGKDLFTFTEKELREYRMHTVGFVWQNNSRNLLPYLSALDNVELPMVIANAKQKRKRASKLLDMVGLSHRRNSKLNQLSGGERQRVAIAIALANEPEILLADEPTGSVDRATTDTIVDLFKELNRSLDITIIIVTHDTDLSRKVERIVAIRDGKVSSEFIKKNTYRNELEELGDEAFHEDMETHTELVVLDRAGRLQLPKDYVEQLKAKGVNKLLIEHSDGKIILSEPQTSEDGTSYERSDV